MPSRRDLIRMTPDEIAAYLAGQSRIILVSIGADGMPHPVPMNYGIDGDGRIVCTSFRKSVKVANLRRDPRATLLVESGDSYETLRAVIVWTDAEVIDDAEEVMELMQLIGAGDTLAASMDPTRREQVRASMTKRVVLRFTPFRMSSWDHARLGGYY